jgi:glycosyltransferase involved in cell wall biosynthesis
MDTKKVTLIIVPRERFSLVTKTLDNIFETTGDIEYDLIYVDCGSPKPIADYLYAKAQEKKFTYLRHEYFLTPNQSRNLGAAHAKTEYLVFIDNDVMCEQGWLKALVECAEKHKADIVSPLICQGNKKSEIIHTAGGTIEIRQEVRDGRVVTILYEDMGELGSKLADVYESFKCEPVNFFEFHCVLVKKDKWAECGGDEDMLNTREHVDFCLAALERNYKIYLEPKSIVTYLHANPLKLYDIHCFLLRWNDQHAKHSMAHFCKKWNLTPDLPEIKRMSTVHWRVRRFVVVPFMKRTGIFILSRTPVYRYIDRIVMKFLFLYTKFLLALNRRKATKYKNAVIYSP